MWRTLQEWGVFGPNKEAGGILHSRRMVPIRNNVPFVDVEFALPWPFIYSLPCGQLPLQGGASSSTLQDCAGHWPASCLPSGSANGTGLSVGTSAFMLLPRWDTAPFRARCVSDSSVLLSRRVLLILQSILTSWQPGRKQTLQQQRKLWARGTLLPRSAVDKFDYNE